MRLFKGLFAVAVAMALSLGAVSAKAGTIIVTFQGTAPSGPNTQFFYDAVLAQGVAPTQVQTGDFFTIYDFQGYTGSHAEPAGWTLTAQNVGVTPTGLLVPDAPTIVNLTWTYSGPTINSVAILGSVGTANPFTATSSISTINPNGFYSMMDQAEIISGPGTGTFQDEKQFANTSVPAAVPVPASAWSGLLLLAGLAAWRRNAKVKQA